MMNRTVSYWSSNSPDDDYRRQEQRGRLTLRVDTDGSLTVTTFYDNEEQPEFGGHIKQKFTADEARRIADIVNATGPKWERKSG